MDLSRSYAESGRSIDDEDFSSDARKSNAFQATKKHLSAYTSLSDGQPMTTYGENAHCNQVVLICLARLFH